MIRQYRFYIASEDHMFMEIVIEKFIGTIALIQKVQLMKESILNFVSGTIKYLYTTLPLFEVIKKIIDPLGAMIK